MISVLFFFVFFLFVLYNKKTRYPSVQKGSRLSYDINGESMCLKGFCKLLGLGRPDKWSKYLKLARDTYIS